MASALGDDSPYKPPNSTTGDKTANFPTDEWAEYPAVQSVDMAGFDITNVANISTSSSATFTDVTASGQIDSTDTTNATDTSTGAIVTAGGVGIAKDVHIGGTLDLSDTLTVTGAATVTDTLSAGLTTLTGTGVDSTVLTVRGSGGASHPICGIEQATGSGTGRFFLLSGGGGGTPRAFLTASATDPANYLTYPLYIGNNPGDIGSESLRVQGNVVSEGYVTVDSRVKFQLSSETESGSDCCIRGFLQQNGEDSMVSINDCSGSFLGVGSRQAANSICIGVGSNRSNNNDWLSGVTGRPAMSAIAIGNIEGRYIAGGVAGLDTRANSGSGFTGGVSLFGRTSAGGAGLFGTGSSLDEDSVFEFIRCDGLNENITNYYPTEITDSTASSSTTTGALTVTGGVGVQGSVNVGGDLNVDGTITGEVVKNYTFAIQTLSSDLSLNNNSATIQSITASGSGNTYKVILPDDTTIAAGFHIKILYEAGAGNTLNIRDNDDTTTFKSLTNIDDWTEAIWNGVSQWVFMGNV